MADRYAVATGNWTDSIWSATSGGAPGASIPVAADNVFFDAASGPITVTLDIGRSVANLDMTGFTGVFAGSATLNIGGSAVLGGTWNHTGTVAFVGTTTGCTVRSNGRVLGAGVQFSGVGGEWTLLDAFNCVGTLLLVNGSFIDAGFSVTCAAFSSSNSNVRSFTKTGQWTITGSGTCIQLSTITNLSFTADGGLRFTSTAATSRTFASGGAFATNPCGGTLAVTGGSGSFTITGASTIGGLNLTGFTGSFNSAGTTVLGDVVFGSGCSSTSSGNVLTMGGSGAQQITTNGVPLNRPLTINCTGTVTLKDALNVGARAFTLTQGTLDDGGFSVSCLTFGSNNSNVRSLIKSAQWTITGTGAVASFATPTNLTFSEAGGFVFTDASAATRTFNIGGLNFTGVFRVVAGTGTFTINGLFASALGSVGSVDFTGFTGSFSTSANSFAITGDLTLDPGMSISVSANALLFNGTGAQKIKTNGVPLNRPVTIACSGSVTLQDAFNTGDQAIAVNLGTFDDGGFTVTCKSFNSSGSSVRSIVKNGTMVVTNATGGANPVALGNTTNLTITCDTTKDWILSYAGSADNFVNFGNLPSLGNLKITGGTYALTLFGGSGVGVPFVDIDFTGFAGTLAGDTGTVKFSRNFVCSASMTLASSTAGLVADPPAGSVSRIYPNGAPLNRYVSIEDVGTLQLVESVDTGGKPFYVNRGVLDLNGQDITCGSFYASADEPSTVTNGDASVLTLTTTGSVPGYNVFRLYPGMTTVDYADMWGEIIFTDTTGGQVSFPGGTDTLLDGGYHFKVVRYTGNGTLSIAHGPNEIDSLIFDISAPCTLSMQDGYTQTINAITLPESSDRVVTVTSTTEGSPAFARYGGGGALSLDYVNARDVEFGPGYSWFMGEHSINLGNNVGVAFCSPENASMMAEAA